MKVTQGEKKGGFDTGVKILKMSFLATNVNLQTLFYGDEIAFDAYIPSFQTIVELAESVLCPALGNGRERSRREVAPTFTFEASLIPPLYFTGIKCRDTRIRRKARELLRYCGVEGIWNGEATAAIVGWVHGVESGNFSMPNCSFIHGSPDHYFGSLATPSASGTESTLESFTPVSTPGSGTQYSEFDFGSSTRIFVDPNTTFNEDVVIPSTSRLRNLKIAISKATSCAYVVSRRKIFFSFVDPLLEGGFQWEYISGIVRWDDEDCRRELRKEEIEEGGRMIRDVVCVYREAMERLDLGMEGKDDDGGGLNI